MSWNDTSPASAGSTKRCVATGERAGAGGDGKGRCSGCGARDNLGWQGTDAWRAGCGGRGRVAEVLGRGAGFLVYRRGLGWVSGKEGGKRVWWFTGGVREGD